MFCIASWLWMWWPYQATYFAPFVGCVFARLTNLSAEIDPNCVFARRALFRRYYFGLWSSIWLWKVTIVGGALAVLMVGLVAAAAAADLQMGPPPR